MSPTAKNTVFFSTANDDYIFNSAISLLSIRQFLPNATLYILSRHISLSNKKFLQHHEIQFIELDLTYLFFQTWQQYPIECYYIFAGPKLFERLGFKYSIYIDGDIVCLRNPLTNCPPIKDVGGVMANSFSEIFGSEKNILTKLFNINSQHFNQHRLQSGVIYMNNQRLNKLHFLEQSGELFHKCWDAEIPRKGDDSLFALFQLVEYKNLSPTTLDDSYNYMPPYKGFKKDSRIIFFHFNFDKPWKYHPYRHKNIQENVFNDYVKSWRNIGRQTSLIKWGLTLSLPIKITSIVKKIQKIISQFPFIIKRLRYPFIKRYINTKKPPIELYWWQTDVIRNFGDIVSASLLYNLFGRRSTLSRPQTCNLIATGSIIEVATQQKHNNKLFVWGSGFIRPGKNSNLDNLIFKAVRGKKTQHRIGNKQIPLGDPGLLINAAFAIKKKHHSNKIGVVIHYADMSTEYAKKFCEDARFEVITPLDEPENVARKIANCSLILSSSLHGLIFADSLSIPNFHIKLSDNLVGGSYKFIDYYSGINKKYTPANIDKIFDDSYLNHLKTTWRPILNLTKKQRALIRAFPFK